MSKLSTILSWNLNGIRASYKKGFADVLENSGADIFCLQEVRALEEQIPEELMLLDWKKHFSAAERTGYSGVGCFAKKDFDEVVTSLELEKFDIEGRLQFLKFGNLWVVNGYFPNGNGKNRDNSRVAYKLEFYRELLLKCENLSEAGHPVLILGDFNTAHQEIDLARPKNNKKTSGFLQEERDEMSRWLSQGWSDTFRAFHAEEEGHYSWWSQRSGARSRNVGWRIDYIMANAKAMSFVKKAYILPDVLGSDHCPIGVDVDPEIYIS